MMGRNGGYPETRIMPEPYYRPSSHPVDSVDRTAQRLVVSTDDGHVAANKDEFLGEEFRIDQEVLEGCLEFHMNLVGVENGGVGCWGDVGRTVGVVWF